MSDFQTWYNASQANRDYYHQTTGTQPKPVDWTALKQMADAGLTEADVRALAGSTSTSTPRARPAPAPRATPTPTPTPTPTSAPTPGAAADGPRHLIDPSTGRLAYIGPNGEAGYAPNDPRIPSLGAQPFTMPDGRIAYYVPWQKTSAYNRGLLEDYYENAPNPTADVDPKTGEERDLRNRSAQAMLREVLGRYGLEDLADWAWQEIQNDRSYEEVLLDLREQPKFKDRFKAIDIRRANGLNAVSPETIIEYENTARDLMRRSGLPSGFYDQFDDFADLIGKGVSLQSVAKRIEASWDRVVNAPTEVREAFGDLYGIRGDQALAALMFDPDKAESQLEEMARSAVAGGAMRAAGFGMDATAAARLAGFDFDDQTVRGGFARLAQLRSVFNETMGERNEKDLDAMREGVNSVFDIGEGTDDIARRIDTRTAEFSGGGGAFASNEGLTGLRSY